MVSERKLAANRRNAKKSTGPKSVSGKKRSSGNALRHGLSVPISKVGSQVQLKELARHFAGGIGNVRIFVLAETAAVAQLELERVRRVKAALIERAASGVGISHSDHGELWHRFIRTDWSAIRKSSSQPHCFKAKSKKEQRFAQSIQLILPALARICRYENRAIGRRDRAIGEIVATRSEASPILSARSEAKNGQKSSQTPMMLNSGGTTTAG